MYTTILKHGMDQHCEGQKKKKPPSVCCDGLSRPIVLDVALNKYGHSLFDGA